MHPMNLRSPLTWDCPEHPSALPLQTKAEGPKPPGTLGGIAARLIARVVAIVGLVVIRDGAVNGDRPLVVGTGIHAVLAVLRADGHGLQVTGRAIRIAAYQVLQVGLVTGRMLDQEGLLGV